MHDVRERLFQAVTEWLQAKGVDAVGVVDIDDEWWVHTSCQCCGPVLQPSTIIEYVKPDGRYDTYIEDVKLSDIIQELR